MKALPIHPLEFCEQPERFLQALIAQYGDAFIYESSHGPVHYFNHPDQVAAINRSPNMVRTSALSGFLGYGLLSSEDDYWQSQRQATQPAFHPKCLLGFVDLINHASKGLLSQWDASNSSDYLIEDISKPIRLCTMEIVMRALFSTDLGDRIADWDDASQALLNGLNPLYCSVLNLIPSPEDTNITAALGPHIEFLDNEMYTLISARREDPNPPRDLLTMLLLTQDNESGKPLSDLQIRDEIATMLMAGHETLAASLSWALYELATQPGLGDRLFAENDAVLQGTQPQYEHLEKMPKLAAFLDETLRIYPPVPFLLKRAVNDDSIDGYTIPADGLVLYSPFTVHRHTDFWKDPEVFNLDHFSPNKIKARHSAAYLPFNTGRHKCIGQTFALMEGQLILAHVIQKFEIIESVLEKPAFRPGLTLRPASPINLKVRRR
jgi:cytochrome P450